MALQLDHLVILVNNLAEAVSDYEAMGFTVTPGGEHTDGATHNALVCFSDGSYLELVAFQQPSPAHRWWRYTATGEGLIDWALLPSRIAADVQTLQQGQLAYTDAIPGGRLRPDGKEIAWEIALPPTDSLPFLCADVTPRGLRVPVGSARSHSNGALGIAALMIVVNDIKASLHAYTIITGSQPANEYGDAPKLPFTETATRMAMLPLGDHTLLVLAEPAPAASATPTEHTLRQVLDSRGEGLYGVALRVAQPSDTGRLPAAQSHGVPFWLVSP